MKKLLAMLLAFTAVFTAGCSKSEKTSDKSGIQPNSDSQINKNTIESAADDNSLNMQTDDAVAEAKSVVKLYLRSGNAEYDSSMLKLMTESFGETYKNMKQSMGHDDAYDEESEMPLEGLKFSFDEQKCRLIEGVHIPEEYSRAAEIYVTVLYQNNDEEKSSEQYAIVVEIDGEWKICFAGSKALAYSEGILKDESSENAELSAKTVYEAAQAAYDELSKDEKYKFEYLNYISTENDRFIKLIKEKLDDNLKNSYFTVFFENGKPSYIVWSSFAGDQVAVTYPDSSYIE